MNQSNSNAHLYIAHTACELYTMIYNLYCSYSRPQCQSNKFGIMYVYVLYLACNNFSPTKNRTPSSIHNKTNTGWFINELKKNYFMAIDFKQLDWKYPTNSRITVNWQSLFSQSTLSENRRLKHTHGKFIVFSHMTWPWNFEIYGPSFCEFTIDGGSVDLKYSVYIFIFGSSNSPPNTIYFLCAFSRLFSLGCFRKFCEPIILHTNLALLNSNTYTLYYQCKKILNDRWPEKWQILGQKFNFCVIIPSLFVELMDLVLE